MTQIVVDADLRAKLLDLKQKVELVDESGHVLATVTPTANVADWIPWEPPIDPEDMRRRAQSTKWYTEEEVLDYLKKLEEEGR
jgi:hypothetical protein